MHLRYVAGARVQFLLASDLLDATDREWSSYMHVRARSLRVHSEASFISVRRFRNRRDRVFRRVPRTRNLPRIDERCPASAISDRNHHESAKVEYQLDRMARKSRTAVEFSEQTAGINPRINGQIVRALKMCFPPPASGTIRQPRTSDFVSTAPVLHSSDHVKDNVLPTEQYARRETRIAQKRDQLDRGNTASNVHEADFSSR